MSLALRRTGRDPGDALREIVFLGIAPVRNYHESGPDSVLL
jgi:hypothetical protein